MASDVCRQMTFMSDNYEVISSSEAEIVSVKPHLYLDMLVTDKVGRVVRSMSNTPVVMCCSREKFSINSELKTKT